MADNQKVRGDTPWRGMPRGDGRNGIDTAYDKKYERKPWHGPLVELHVRRTQEQLETLLADRLAELRANPPIGYPRD